MGGYERISNENGLVLTNPINSRLVGNAEVIPVALQRPLAARTGFRKVGRALQVQIA